MLSDKQVRLIAGVRQLDVAREAGVVRQTVALYEAKAEAIKDEAKRARLAAVYAALRAKLGQ